MGLPKRKHPRLKDYDYSQPGYYYVTIHTQKDSGVLSNVGQGLAPAEAKVFLSAAGRIGGSKPPPYADGCDRSI